MRTTITIDDDLFEEAQRMVNARKPSELFSLSLQALVKQEKAKRLAALGGSIPNFKTPVRNR
ncbi:MAG: type II toxin-antitoxin system VapB family antitoxin [Coriobacteriia bacterium]|nr:type II toxin-antitoxin system VapB family antitoxin [Coriobacteriia bacterium]MDR2714446.1 type II toxin-antitoxin system VapB family antitoxin [Coriobacteriales bacterium]